MHGIQDVSFCAGLNCLRNNRDVYAVCGLGECADEELVVLFLVNITRVAAVNFKVADFDIAQVTERIKPPAKVVDAALAAEEENGRL